MSTKAPAVEIHDVTLREGEQSAGVAFTPGEKAVLATELARMGIRSLQAGFPSLSPEDRAGVAAVVEAAAALSPPLVVHCLCLPREEDFDLARSLGVGHVALSLPVTGPHLRRAGLDPAGLESWVGDIVGRAVRRGLWVRVSAEDVGRAPAERVIAAYRAAALAGAGMVTVADTSGGMLPQQVARWVRKLRAAVGLPVSVHCHNDFGLATANTVAAWRAGASQLQVTVSGIGERAGLASLEEVAAIIALLYRHPLGLDLRRLVPLAELVHRLSGLERPVFKAVSGLNAFSHECGLHVGLLAREPQAYQPVPPEELGAETRVVFGKHSSPESIDYLAERHHLPLDEGQRRLLLALVRALGGAKMALGEDAVLCCAAVLAGPGR